jgi:hypothetical protein
VISKSKPAASADASSSGKRGPPSFISRLNLVATQSISQRCRRVVVREDSHPGSVAKRLGYALGSMLQDQVYLLADTPGNHSMKFSTVAPPSMLTNSAETGTRVPRNIQVPLSFRGSRSTALQVVQSSINPIMRRWRCRDHLDGVPSRCRSNAKIAGTGWASNRGWTSRNRSAQDSRAVISRNRATRKSR